MALLQLEGKPDGGLTLPILRLGFRPFFLLAGSAAVVLMVIWITMLAKGRAVGVYGMINWHAHEMLFGYSVAVIAGFLLTAEKNWTGLQTLYGWRLAVLAMLWLLGRIVPWLPLPGWLIALLDLSFLPLLGLALLRPLLRSSQWQHLIFVVIVLLLFVANVLFHLGYLAPAWHTAGLGIQLGWMTILFLIILMGGRVIPFFIERGTGSIVKLRHSRMLDGTGFVAILCWMLATLFASQHAFLVAWLAWLAAALQLLRWWGWHLPAVWRLPMLWILYLGYAWIPLGLFLDGYAMLQGSATSLALHTFTAGAIGMITLGMMARVALGHTGREIQAGPLVITAFVLVTLAAVVRVFGPLWMSTNWHTAYLTVISLAGTLWGLGFLLFVLAYLPILTRARVDQRPG